MRTNANNDIIRKATGETTTVPVVPERKFGAKVAATTDKMGITTGGALARGFIWGLVIGAAVVMGVGLYASKINISYTK